MVAPNWAKKVKIQGRANAWPLAPNCWSCRENKENGLLFQWTHKWERLTASVMLAFIIWKKRSDQLQHSAMPKPYPEQSPTLSSKLHEGCAGAKKLQKTSLDLTEVGSGVLNRHVTWTTLGGDTEAVASYLDALLWSQIMVPLLTDSHYRKISLLINSDAIKDCALLSFRCQLSST